VVCTMYAAAAVTLCGVCVPKNRHDGAVLVARSLAGHQARGRHTVIFGSVNQ
jgi:hypothetical protein